MTSPALAAHAAPIAYPALVALSVSEASAEPAAPSPSARRRLARALAARRSELVSAELMLALSALLVLLAMVASAGLSPAHAGSAIFAAASSQSAAASDANDLDATLSALADYARDKLPATKAAPNYSPAQSLLQFSDPAIAAAHAGVDLSGAAHGAGAPALAGHGLGGHGQGGLGQGGHGQGGHGQGAHGQGAHAAGVAGSGLSVPRYGTLLLPQLSAFASLRLPEDAATKRAADYAKLNARVARPLEQRLLRANEGRLQRVQQAKLQREPDYVTLMPAAERSHDNVETAWVAIDQVDDMAEMLPRFDFVQILSARSDTNKPILIAAQKQPKATAAAASARAPMVAPAPGDPDGRYFVGSKPCQTCHAGLFDEFQETVMGRNIKSGKVTPQGKMECETCHGPGSAHVNGGGGREKGGIRSFRLTDTRGVDVAEYNGICLSCHEKGDQTYWKGSAHESRDLACVNCHTVMRKTSPRNQLKTALVMDTCFQCHKDRKAQIQRTSHMPIRETKITCTSCHNPHGSAADKLLREATVNDVCYTCHADKRGPFLFEHAPVRENCLNCHEPHGSNHDALLIVARPRLCQTCHAAGHSQAGLSVAPGTLLPGGSMRYAAGDSCQNCHTNVHGSNSPSGSRWHR